MSLCLPDLSLSASNFRLPGLPLEAPLLQPPWVCLHPMTSSPLGFATSSAPHGMGCPARTVPCGGSASSGGRGTSVVSQTQGRISLLALLSCVSHASEPTSLNLCPHLQNRPVTLPGPRVPGWIKCDRLCRGLSAVLGLGESPGDGSYRHYIYGMTLPLPSLVIDVF